MRDVIGFSTHVTTRNDPRITPLGRLLRKTKADELPQLINILRGDMSFVGPRPDVPEVALRLEREAPDVLTVRPGVTGPATIKYRNEEEILAQQNDPERFNDEVIYPDKIRINQAYVDNYRFVEDLRLIWLTLTRQGHAAAPEDFAKGLQGRCQAA